METNMTATNYPEIDCLSMRNAREALIMGLNAYDSLTPEGQDIVRPRIAALRARIAKLEARASYRLQIRTAANGKWETITTARDGAGLLADMAKLADISTQVRIMHGNMQIQIAGGR